jgi:hypothetical protein
MHFWWCGLLCSSALLDTDQGARDEDDDKRKNYWGKGGFSSFASLVNVLADKLLL